MLHNLETTFSNSIQMYEYSTALFLTAHIYIVISKQSVAMGKNLIVYTFHSEETKNNKANASSSKRSAKSF